MKKEYISFSKAAAELPFPIHPNTLRNWATAGKNGIILPSIAGKVKVQEIYKFLDAVEESKGKKSTIYLSILAKEYQLDGR